MDGSGIAELLETSYGPNSVNHMLSGKAVSRALRGYFLADAALNVKLLQTVTNVGNETEEMLTEDEVDGAAGISDEVPAASADLSPGLVSSPKGYPYNEQSRTPCSSFSMTEDAVSEMQRLVVGFQNGTVTLNQILESDDFNLLSQTLVSIISYLEKISHTSKLWLLYMTYVDVIKLFISAERTGSWEDHLVAATQMLNLFAATGHHNYAKSTRLYLQIMQDLPQSHPWLHEQFVRFGYHTVRRSDRFWAGIWTDLAIEQILMRSVKSRGGLTRGRGFSESVRILWVYSMHKCANNQNAMSDLTNLKQIRSEQHVDLGKSRIQRDFKDLSAMMSWLSVHNPFDETNNSLVLCLTHNLLSKE